MRTNIDIDDELMAAALAAGPFKTKKDAVEAGLRLLEKQAAARELLKLEGKLDWGWGDEDRLSDEPNWASTTPQTAGAPRATAPKAKKRAVRRSTP